MSAVASLPGTAAAVLAPTIPSPALSAAGPEAASTPSSAPRAATVAAVAAAALAACGGGDGAGELPAAMAQGTAGAERRHLLGSGGDTATRAAATGSTPTATELMDWAEKAYVGFFPTHEADRTQSPYVYRYYAATGNYLGVANGRVYVYGPVAGGNQLVDVGALADFATRIQVVTRPADDAQAARFLAQASLGVTDADMAAVKAQGYDGWLDAEMARAASKSNWQYLIDKGIAANSDNRNSQIGTDPAIWQRLISAPDGLRQRVTLALSEILVVGFDGITGPWKQFKLAAWWDLLADHAFGNYRTLLEAVTLNAAMGQYLSAAGNQKENAATGRLPDENYAREVMQLFSIGLYELGPDGTPKVDAKGAPIETYTQDAVSQLARVFTGWNLDVSPFDNGPDVMKRPMVLNANQHSTLAVSALGMTIPAGTDGTTALRMTLDTLTAHPNVGPFIGRQLIQRLVKSNPSPAYVTRVSQRWANNGQGVRGDLAAVVRAILTDEEARDPARAAEPGSGKLREPLLRFVHWARSFRVTSISGDWTIGNLSDNASRLGQSPLRSPSVFNFFRPGFVPPDAGVTAAELVAPEFQITSETTVAGYLNFMQTAIPGNRFDLRPDYTAELALVGSATSLLTRVELLLAANSLSASTRVTILNALSAMPTNTDSAKANRVYAAVLLVMASPEYLIQK